jgi:indole-3-glycerol phosphate synthase
MILDDILAEKRRAVSSARLRIPLAEIEARAAAIAPTRGFLASLRSASGIACIAEFKRRSPSKGWIRRAADVAEVVAAYQRGGASAISVLTDTPFFGGELADLTSARAATELPILRKDFVIDPYQVAEARAAGADALLLIVAALGERDLRELLAATRAFGMEALVETHDADELRRAIAAGARVIGVNNRDLRTFHVDTDLAVELRPQVPGEYLMVAESGVRTADDVQRLRRAGIEAVLVGEALMRSPDPESALRELLA